MNIPFRHNSVSDLHRQNLENLERSRGPPASSSSSSFAYRDRAKERRQKYGADDAGGAPRHNSLKEKYLRAVQEQESSGLPERNIDATNIGNQMLQKMGWKEGLGLGKSNQGRTSIIEVRGFLKDFFVSFRWEDIVYPKSYTTSKELLEHILSIKYALFCWNLADSATNVNFKLENGTIYVPLFTGVKKKMGQTVWPFFD